MADVQSETFNVLDLHRNLLQQSHPQLAITKNLLDQSLKETILHENIARKQPLYFYDENQAESERRVSFGSVASEEISEETGKINFVALEETNFQLAQAMQAMHSEKKEILNDERRMAWDVVAEAEQRLLHVTKMYEDLQSEATHQIRSVTERCEGLEEALAIKRAALQEQSAQVEHLQGLMTALGIAPDHKTDANGYEETAIHSELALDRRDESVRRLVGLVNSLNALTRSIQAARCLHAWAHRLYRIKHNSANVVRQHRRHARRVRAKTLRHLRENVRAERRYRAILSNFLPGERLDQLRRGFSMLRTAVAQRRREESGSLYSVREARRICRPPFRKWQELRSAAVVGRMRSVLDGWLGDRPNGVRFLINRRKRQRPPHVAIVELFFECAL